MFLSPETGSRKGIARKSGGVLLLYFLKGTNRHNNMTEPKNRALHKR